MSAWISLVQLIPLLQGLNAKGAPQSFLKSQDAGARSKCSNFLLSHRLVTRYVKSLLELIEKVLATHELDAATAKQHMATEMSKGYSCSLQKGRRKILLSVVCWVLARYKTGPLQNPRRTAHLCNEQKQSRVCVCVWNRQTYKLHCI